MSTAPSKARLVEPTAAEPGIAAPSASLFAEPGKRALLLSVLLVVFTFAIYGQTAHFPFVNFDDDRYVTANPHVLVGLTWDTVKWAFTSTSVANWHPLTWISHALDCQLFHLNAGGHHFTSILLHAMSATLLFLLLWRATRRMSLSFVVALVFALHPVNVESVAWISERKNVLSMLFFLLTLGAYGWYAQKPDWKRYLAVAGVFACGLASKPMVVTLPFVLLLLDYWPLRRIQGSRETGAVAVEQAGIGKLVLEKLPLLLLSAASAVITMRAQTAAGAATAATFPLAVRLKNAIYCYLMYAWKTIWPAKLAPLYPHPEYSLPVWKAAVAALFLIAVTAVVVKFRSRRYLPVGWLWFLGTLVPVIGLVQVGNQAMADRYAYIPLIGLFVMIVWRASDLADRMKVASAWRIAAAAGMVIALVPVAYRQIGYWRSSLDLWAHTLEVTSNNFGAEDDFGAALVQLGRTDEAYSHFVRAAQLAPTDPVSHTNIGFYLYQHGHPAEALRYFKVAAALTIDTRVLATTYADLGFAYCELGDYPRSRASFDRSIQLNADDFNTWLGFGLLAEREGKLTEAMRDLAFSLQRQPSARGYFELGRVLDQTGDKTRALAAYGLALKISPDYADAQAAAAALQH